MSGVHSRARRFPAGCWARSARRLAPRVLGRRRRSDQGQARQLLRGHAPRGGQGARPVHRRRSSARRRVRQAAREGRHRGAAAPGQRDSCQSQRRHGSDQARRPLPREVPQRAVVHPHARPTRPRVQDQDLGRVRASASARSARRRRPSVAASTSSVCARPPSPSATRTSSSRCRARTSRASRRSARSSARPRASSSSCSTTTPTSSAG